MPDLRTTQIEKVICPDWEGKNLAKQSAKILLAENFINQAILKKGSMGPATTSCSFHSALCAAAEAGVPMDLGSGPVGRTTANRLDQLREQTSLASAASFGDVQRYVASRKTYDRLGGISLVLDGLSANRVALRKLENLVRSSLIYLLVMMFIASVCLMFFEQAIAPEFEAMRADMKMPLRFVAPERAIPRQTMKTFGTGLSLLVAFCTIALLCGGASRVGQLFGGANYRRSVMAAMASQIVAALIQKGETEDQAVALASDVVGLDASNRNRMHQLALMGNAMNDSCFLSFSQESASLAKSYMATLRFVCPLVIVGLLGGALVGFYCFLLFAPLVDLIHDLSQVVI